MSLLLDALKKAEQEKLKAREAEAAAAEGIDPELEPADTPDAAPIEQQPDAIHEDEPEIEEADNGGLELLLDEDDDQEKLEQQGAEQAKEELEVPEPQLAPMEMEKSSATTSTVSDEALHLFTKPIKITDKDRGSSGAAWCRWLSLFSCWRVLIIILVW